MRASKYFTAPQEKVGAFVKFINAEMEINKGGDQNKHRQPDCQASDIDDRISFVVNDVSNRGIEVVGKHNDVLRVTGFGLGDS